MNEGFKKTLCRALEAEDIEERETLQSLWSGYGKIARYAVSGADVESVVVKLVRIPSEVDHPRGWHSNFSQERKIRSYEVEAAWYRGLASKCDAHCRIPACFATAAEGSEVMIALEDLDASGFTGRKDRASVQEMKQCLAWLASFHARHMGQTAGGLWPKGTYWHLDTRPDELEALSDLPLKRAAKEIDRILDGCQFKTLLHGDAKLANFCFDEARQGVAAVDFQYVGGGCGMKDVAYFVGSCLSDTECERFESELLDAYFGFLVEALERYGSKVSGERIESEWRPLYPVAWTDFHRFLKGWSPGHWKVHSYSERLSREVLSNLPR
ncbi:phosphotransferase [Pelagicoccus enzymogenes]|uniref:phosphotransferase n=1 Tax=Pelagicoccus enzymogenes TaxID=2773457 RepID=UPI00280F8DD3|nr:phosphotransferase [Pelagicoccus enzymogenes]MDQ8200238.1 phosphotransferase [Pelagicoccus enzymogenes]